MPTATYIERRSQLEDYFDRTAVEAWKRLTSDAPVGRIRATVRAGRDQMRQTLLDCLPADLTGRRVLDAGCGTGLCGAFLRPRARVLVGVDLSSGMLRRAKTLNVYDQLIEAELTGFLEGHPDAYDAIVSADTLCYFGDLEAVFKAAAGALKPSGRLFLTVEKAPDSASDSYHLQSHGRFNHAASYVRRQLEGTGFAVDTIQEAELRQEAGASVLGLVVTATRHARL
jgi:magnesium protoporphyrin O-methyltransferase